MLFGIDSPNINKSSVIRIKIVNSFRLVVVFKTKVKIELKAMLAKLLPIKIVVRKVSGLLANSFAIFAKKEDRAFISSFILFAVTKAISLAEKNDDKRSKIKASINSVCIFGRLLFLNKKAQSFCKPCARVRLKITSFE